MGVLDYTGAIKITFDRPIINDPLVVLSTEAYKPSSPYSAITQIASGEYAPYYPKSAAFDGNTGSNWRAYSTAAGQWIGLNFGGPVTINKTRIYTGWDAVRINAYEIQWSDDGSTWTTIASGNLANTSAWQEVTFDDASHQYWRLVGNSRYSSYYGVSEVEFCGTRNVYDVSGWAVTSQEYRYVPDGDLISKTHTIRKVTRSADMLSVTLWLDMYSRMKAPAGLVTVAYDKTTGNLKGMGNLQVESFTLTFTPANITPVNNALVTESMELTPAVTTILPEVTYNYSQTGTEHISLTPTVTAALIHVDDLEQ